mmetsp:Transcript_93175/g.266263  ORF Transcript_93175/g.266263 Transcript_93175/m.266263 type:complete len:207 (+) Transcript_93175:1982-2602(+)
MTHPYRNELSGPSEYVFPKSRPRMVHRCMSSALFRSCLVVPSRTFSTFPLSGNTPYVSRPNVSSPATASALAESPSVSISVQAFARAVPARRASSSFGILRPRNRLLPPGAAVSLRMAANCFLLAASTTAATIPAGPSRSTPSGPSMNGSPRPCSGSSHVEPKDDGLEMSISFICESKVGLSTKQLMKTCRCDLIIEAVTVGATSA